MARLSEAQHARNVLILTGVGHFGTHFFELLFPTLAVTLAGQTSMPLGEVLGWSFLGYLLFGLGALPAAWLTERVSPRLLFIAALFGLGVAALAASEAPNGRVLSFSLAAMGACASVLHPAGASLIARSSATGSERARRVNGVLAGLAIVLTPLITATLCARLGWQPTLRCVGYVICAAAVACGFVRVAELQAPRPDALPSALPRRDGWLQLSALLAAAALGGIAARGATLVLPGYFAARLSAIGFGAATSLAYAVGMAGPFAARRLAERYGPRRLYRALYAISLPALLLMAALSGLPLLGAAGLFAFAAFAMQPIEQRLLAPAAPPPWSALADAGRRALTYGVGALGVWLVGWGSASGGLSHALLWLAPAVGLGAGAAALLVSLDARRRLAPGGRRSVGAGVGEAVFGVSQSPAEGRPPEPARVP